MIQVPNKLINRVDPCFYGLAINLAIGIIFLSLIFVSALKCRDTVLEASTVDVRHQKHTQRSNTWTSQGVGYCCSFAR